MLESIVSARLLTKTYRLDNLDGDVQRDGDNVLKHDQTGSERQPTDRSLSLHNDDKRVDVYVVRSERACLVGVCAGPVQRAIVPIYKSGQIVAKLLTKDCSDDTQNHEDQKVHHDVEV